MVKAESLGDNVIWVEAKTLATPLLTEEKWSKPAGMWETNPRAFLGEDSGDGCAAMDKTEFNRVDMACFIIGQQSETSRRWIILVYTSHRETKPGEGARIIIYFSTLI
ncbi:hypothetical protein CARUB_v10021186mg [Capsella rubella]|uniref:Uncharacterized protein n=1 Tax=Capsella rubella TaxID=81985 RepID=R0IGI5_9BRAS|nr:hypothetical protein CARUB_v10021186mg [Capsella rubella]EOA35929.1 hypothetical protein CARUB_v10021186mg [Capsella rubella]